MKKYLFFCIWLLLPLTSIAQTYKYIGVENGLNSRRVYAIQKDRKGYMWFLTHDGIDRYNGKEFKSYTLTDGDKEVNTMINLNWLDIGPDGTLWEIGKKGRVFRYDNKHDRFQLVYRLPEHKVKNRPAPISHGFVDSNNVVWLCNKEEIYLYHNKLQKATVLKNSIRETITDVAQIDSTHYFIGTNTGIHYTELKNDTLTFKTCDERNKEKIQVNKLYYHEPSEKVFIGTFQRGIFVYDFKQNKITHLNAGLTDVSINSIRLFNTNEILIATDGAGVYKMNTDTYQCEPYIMADYTQYNAMNGNTINDLYIDDEQHIWMANYPIGITVRNNQYASYQWIKHSIGNPQSLVNDQVNAIIEDQDGDLWYATNNGISLNRSKTGKWHSFLSESNFSGSIKNNTFISLCEVSPGIIWAGGYTSGIYEINKRTSAVTYFTPSLFSNSKIRSDKYIRAMTKTSDDMLWLGGYYNLKEIDYAKRQIRLFPGLSGITVLEEKNEDYMWVGTDTGLYLLEKETGEYEYIRMPVESYYIYSLYQSPDGLLYIGTNNAGLLIYNPKDQTFKHYHKDNSALISNNIYTILHDNANHIILSTEKGLSCFNITEKTVHNWTKEQGLKSDHFNATSGTLTKNGDFIFGSTDGAIEFNKDDVKPRHYKSKLVFSDLRVFYQTVFPEDKGSPLLMDIDETQTLRLKYNQNIFSLQVSSINYDYPSLILYSWKLEGFYEGWSRPSQENIIRFTNLSPGTYTLRVRAISNEDRRVTLEERSMEIIIEQPGWLSIWAILLYIIAIIFILGITLRIIIMKKQRKESDEKIRFFVNTAHDIRTPLTLIKAPLEELSERETLSENGQSNMNTALRNVNALLRLTTNLINFERAGTYSGNLYVSEYELGSYMEESINVFRSYANVRHIQLTYEKNFRYLNIWLDKDKMDSILKNIISNALKYTPEGGNVHIYAAETEDNWSIEVKDDGIGIPASEQKKLFKMHFRGSNAVNSKITGSGIGLLLVSKLVRMHKGKLTFSSTEGKGSTIKVTFPKGDKYYSKAIHHPNPNVEKASYSPSGVPVQVAPVSVSSPEKAETETPVNDNRLKLLIVEDNDELRDYLQNALSEEYNIQICSNGKQGLVIVKEYLPNLIISDIMMPEMRGDELCQILKNDIETSHIPIILLTALNTDKNIIEGLQAGADEYIVKPFNIGILRATIANLLRNHAILRKKYANLELNDDEHDTSCINCSSDLDWKFIAMVKQHVEENMDNSNFNVDMLSNLLNMSRTSFYNKIKALTDEAPADYIRLIKMKRAALLLKEKKHTVTEIAEMSGFSDAKYFREVFKKHFKVSPSQYAKNNVDKPTK